MKCPSCGHTWTTSKPRATAAPVTDTATMSSAELYAHYKRTAPYEDLLFFIRTTQAPGPVSELEAAAIRLLQTAFSPTGDRLIIQRSAFYQQLAALHQRWRTKDRPPSDEAAFWRAAGRQGQRERARKYRQQRDRLIGHLHDAREGRRATHYCPTPNWSMSETIDGMIAQLETEVRDLVRAARAICPRVADTTEQAA